MSDTQLDYEKDQAHGALGISHDGFRKFLKLLGYPAQFLEIAFNNEEVFEQLMKLHFEQYADCQNEAKFAEMSVQG